MIGRGRSLTARLGSWALVTGATQGIGRAMAVELARRGFNLVICSRNEASLRQLRQELVREWPIACEFHAADLSDLIAVERLVEFCDGLDIGLVVAAAGFGSSGPFLNSNILQETEMIDLNCTSVAVLAWHFGRQFKQQRRGTLVLFSSVLAFNGVPWAANYAATKAYIQSLGEALAREWRAHGASVLTCAPGPTRSGFADRAKLEMGRAQSAEQVARHAIQALERNWSFTRPGTLSRLLGWSLALLPRFFRTMLLGQVMKGMAGKYR